MKKSPQIRSAEHRDQHFLGENAKRDPRVCIYIYIYMAVTSLGGPKKGKNLKNAQFYS